MNHDLVGKFGRQIGSVDFVNESSPTGGKMKYVSVVIFILLMAVTWSMSQTSATADMQQHKQIEAGFEDFIRSSIQKQIPNVKDIVFRQLFTETIRPDEVMKAHFRYDVVAPTQGGDVTAQTVEGSVTMQSKDQGLNWTIVGEQVSSPTIRFEEGIRISPRDESPKVPTDKADSHE